ncbi:MAG: NAD-dependent deacetylase [Paraglaciecola sp.]|jgi:NAD-dependent deacetylase
MGKYKKIVVLTGAGISAESGLKTFRDNDGLWENHRVEDVATPEAFSDDPGVVYKFYNARRAQLIAGDVHPNAAHFALFKLEQHYKDNFLLVTQNVDDLHEQAGSERLMHMHGDLLSARCCHSGRVYFTRDSFDGTSRCHCCLPQEPIRPNIVWFGEMPMFMDEISQSLSEADLFISIGTSGNVYPAAGFVQQANYSGAHTVELNLQPSLGQNEFNEKHYGKAGTIVPNFVEQLLAE